MSQAILGVTGKLSKDGEVGKSPSGTPYLRLTIPVQKGKDKPTTWITATVLGKRVDNASFVNMFKKGAIVSASGELEVREYEKKDGTQGYSIGVLVNSVDVEFVPQTGSASETEEF